MFIVELHTNQKSFMAYNLTYRRFTKRLCGMSNLSYASIGLRLINLHTLEYRRLQHDLIYVYKILFGRVTVDHSKMFTVTHYVTRTHQEMR